MIITAFFENVGVFILNHGKRGKRGNMDMICIHLALFALFATLKKGIPPKIGRGFRS